MKNYVPSATSPGFRPLQGLPNSKTAPSQSTEGDQGLSLSHCTGPVVPGAVGVPLAVQQLQNLFQQQFMPLVSAPVPRWVADSDNVRPGPPNAERRHATQGLSQGSAGNGLPIGNALGYAPFGLAQVTAIAAVFEVCNRVEVLWEQRDAKAWHKELPILAQKLPCPARGALTPEAEATVNQVLNGKPVVRSHVAGMLHYFHYQVSPASPWRQALRRNAIAPASTYASRTMRKECFKDTLVRLSWLMPRWCESGAPSYRDYLGEKERLLGTWLANLNTAYASFANRAMWLACESNEAEFLADVLDAFAPEYCSRLLAVEFTRSSQVPDWLQPGLNDRLAPILAFGTPFFPSSALCYRESADPIAHGYPGLNARAHEAARAASVVVPVLDHAAQEIDTAWQARDYKHLLGVLRQLLAWLPLSNDERESPAMGAFLDALDKCKPMVRSLIRGFFTYANKNGLPRSYLRRRLRGERSENKSLEPTFVHAVNFFYPKEGRVQALRSTLVLLSWLSLPNPDESQTWRPTALREAVGTLLAALHATYAAETSDGSNSPLPSDVADALQPECCSKELAEALSKELKEFPWLTTAPVKAALSSIASCSQETPFSLAQAANTGGELQSRHAVAGQKRPLEEVRGPIDTDTPERQRSRLQTQPVPAPANPMVYTQTNVRPVHPTQLPPERFEVPRRAPWAGQLPPERSQVRQPPFPLIDDRLKKLRDAPDSISELGVRQVRDLIIVAADLDRPGELRIVFDRAVQLLRLPRSTTHGLNAEQRVAGVLGLLGAMAKRCAAGLSTMWPEEEAFWKAVLTELNDVALTDLRRGISGRADEELTDRSQAARNFLRELSKGGSAKSPLQVSSLPPAQSPQGGELPSEDVMTPQGGEGASPPGGTNVLTKEQVRASAAKLRYNGHATPSIRRPLPSTPPAISTTPEANPFRQPPPTPDHRRLFVVPSTPLSVSLYDTLEPPATPAALDTPQVDTHPMPSDVSPLETLAAEMSEPSLDMDAIRHLIENEIGDGSWLSEAVQLVQVMVASNSSNQTHTVLGWLRDAQRRLEGVGPLAFSSSPQVSNTSSASSSSERWVETLTAAGVMTTTTATTTDAILTDRRPENAMTAQAFGEVTARLQLLDEADGISPDDVGYIDLGAPAGPPVIVKGPQKYDASLEGVFPVRDPRFPQEVHRDFRSPKDHKRCHSKVKIQGIRLQRVLVPAEREGERDRMMDAAQHLMGYLGHFDGPAKFKRAADLKNALVESIRQELEANLKGRAGPSMQRIEVVTLSKGQCDDAMEADSLAGCYGVILKDYALESQPSIANGRIVGIFAGSKVATDQDETDYRHALGHRASAVIRDYGARLDYRGRQVDCHPYGGGNAMQYLNSTFARSQATGLLHIDAARTNAAFLRFNVDIVAADGKVQTEPMYAVVQVAPVVPGKQLKLDYGETYVMSPDKEEPALTRD